MTAARVVLVDDHALVRRGLASLLRTDGRFEVAGEAGNGADGVELVRRVRPDVVILDLSMPEVDGLEALRRLRALPNPPRVLILSMHDELQLVSQALRDGADGYLLKDSMDDELFEALEAVLRGQRYVADAIDGSRLRLLSVQASPLTARERDVLRLIAAGRTTQEVAVALRISPHTATRHRANLMQKLDAHNQVELLRHAASRGLVVIDTPTGPGDPT